MKRLFLIPVLFLAGCGYKDNLATNVVDLAGNIKVIGWDDKKHIKKPKIFSPQKPHFVDSDADGVVDYMDRCPNTPKNTLVNHYGCPIITTLRINFDFNKTDVKKIYYPKIKKIADILKANPKLKIEIDGYTDNVGDKNYNLKLSLKRAEAIKKILVYTYHINPNRIKVKGFGEKYPLVPNTTPTNRALNRRVEIIAIKKESKYMNTTL